MTRAQRAQRARIELTKRAMNKFVNDMASDGETAEVMLCVLIDLAAESWITHAGASVEDATDIFYQRAWSAKQRAAALVRTEGHA